MMIEHHTGADLREERVVGWRHELPQRGHGRGGAAAAQDGGVGGAAGVALGIKDRRWEG
jgi:hypothetical protein